MNWKRMAIEDLKSYEATKQSETNIEKKIKALESRFVSLQGMSTDEPVKGGASSQEEKMINNIAERDRLKLNLEAVKKINAIIENGLSVLDEKQRTVIDEFYIHRKPEHVERLCEKFNFEKTRIYEIKEEALTLFTKAMYGIVEL